jgi:cytochrome c-type biogenesis protein CcmF
MKIGSTTHLAGYDFTLKEVNAINGPNYVAARGVIDLSRNGVHINTLTPEKRVYTATQSPMTEASLDNGIFRDIYASMGEATSNDTWIVRLYYKPFVSWIWGGCLLMAFGGVLAASDKRYRKLATRDASKTVAVQAA